MVINPTLLQPRLMHDVRECRAEVALTTKELRRSCENHFPRLFAFTHLRLLIQFKPIGLINLSIQHRQDNLHSWKTLGTEQMFQKMIHTMLVYLASNARKEDLCRVHAYIWLGREILAEAIARKELLDKLSITIAGET